MKGILFKSLILFFLLARAPKIVFAYIGPGTGLSAIGAFLACLLGIIVAILGFFWYPIKRLLGNKLQEPDQQEPDQIKSEEK